MTPYAYLINLLILVVFVTAILVAYLSIETLGPVVRRRWPRLAAFVSSLLPLPCTHTDRHGSRLTYRERRLVNGIQVMHWVCDACGHAEPTIDRHTDDANARAIVQGKPAHESMKAYRTAPPAQVVNVNFTKRGRG